MTAENQNFTMYAGDSKRLRIAVMTPEGDPVDLTGSTMKWAVKEGASTILLKNGAGVTITDAANGVFTVDLAPIDTRTFSGTYNHIGEMTNSSGQISTILTGLIFFEINRL